MSYMKKGSILLGIGTMLFTPVVASAQLGQPELGRTDTLISNIGDIVNTLTPIVLGIIVIAFLWGLAKYVYNADDEEARKQGKNIMIAGVIALFLASAIWGIVAWLEAEFGVSGDFTGDAPTVEGVGSDG